MQDDDSAGANSGRKEIEVKLIVDNNTVSLWWDNTHIVEFEREWYEKTKSNAADSERPVEAIVSQAVDEHTDKDTADINWVR